MICLPVNDCLLRNYRQKNTKMEFITASSNISLESSDITDLLKVLLMTPYGFNKPQTLQHRLILTSSDLSQTPWPPQRPSYASQIPWLLFYNLSVSRKADSSPGPRDRPPVPGPTKQAIPASSTLGWFRVGHLYPLLQSGWIFRPLMRNPLKNVSLFWMM